MDSVVGVDRAQLGDVDLAAAVADARPLVREVAQTHQAVDGAVEAALSLGLDRQRVGGRLEERLEHHVLQVVADVVELGLELRRVDVRLGRVEASPRS